MAFGGHGPTAAVQVITLGAGRMRQWVLPRTSWTPTLSGDGAWTANGRTLMLQQQIILHGLPVKPRNDLNILGALTGNTFTPSGSNLLQQPAGYRALQYALRTSRQMTW